MRHIYRVHTDTVLDESGMVVTVYGVQVVDPEGNTLQTIPDIFFDPSEAQRFVSQCNRGGLRPIHLRDAVENALCECMDSFPSARK